MGDSKKRKNETKSKIYRSRGRVNKARKEVAISPFRPLVRSPELTTSLLLFHEGLQEFLERLGMGDSVERVALNGLRFTLMPPRYLSTINNYNPNLTHAPEAKKHILQALPFGKETIPDVRASRARISKRGENNVIALIFDDQRLVDESIAAQEAINMAHGSTREPPVELCSIPVLGRQTTEDLTLQLSRAALQVTASFGPVKFGK